ncbi:MAG TPA: phosphopantetheine-binding protein, partial [Candidatus Ozemobacteraceae bacterium]|nr:phosphopantetheine-binding protein [Candidatus Ozemobacteraceae bacterium]
ALFEKVRDVCARFLNVPPESITPQKRLVEFLQLDSLGLVALLAHFQEVFRVSLRDVDLATLRDFSAVCHLIMRKGNWEELCDLKTAGLTSDAMPPLLDYSEDGIKRRRKFLKNRHGIDPSVFGQVANADDLNGNIEGFVGYSMVPIGIAGPLKVNGEYARGDFFLPLATTEGALVSSIARGTQIITMSGGARTRVLADSLVRAPVFLFSTLDELASFKTWIDANLDLIREAAEKTTRHGKLLDIENYPMGTTMCLRFVYSTADASGQNMTTIATHAAMDYIKKAFPGKMVDCFLEANMSGDKKVNGLNFTRNRGKRVLAEVLIPRDVVEKHLHTTPERIARLSQLAMVSSLHAHSFGSQAHYANVLAAVFIATGNDAACVAESAVGVTTFTVEGNDLQATVTLPGLMIGTVGGGTRLPTQQTCLEIMDCAGPRKAKKFAEILAAGVLAGEISLTAAMAADEFATAHARYGRKLPGTEPKR